MSSRSGGGLRRVSALNVDPKALRQRAIKVAEAVGDRCLGKPEARGKRAQEDGQLLDRWAAATGKGVRGRDEASPVSPMGCSPYGVFPLW
jgi:hypothetical protein